MVQPSDEFDITKRAPPDGALADVLMTLIGIVGSVFMLPQAAAAGNAELVRQRSMQQAQPTLNTPQEAAEAVHRGVIDEGTYLELMSRHGFTEDSAGLIRQISRPLLNIGELVALWLRDELTEEEMREEVAKHGFTDERIAHLETLAFPIPQIQDLVLFAVREVFDVAQAEAFGQFEGVSTESRRAFEARFAPFGTGPQATTAAFEEFAKQSGLAPEWATAFWASHWQLPSPNQMFEMFHRRIIDRGTLEVGIRALDFTGFWREKLLGISFRPLTRVDIRRFHALGLMTEDEVQLRYQDVGFSPDDAALMTEFTVAFNAPDDEVDVQELRDLTRTQILRFLRNGLFTESQATAELIAIGFSDPNTRTIVALELIQQDQDLQDNAIAIIRARLRNGAIDEGEAVSQLDALDLPVPQRDLVLAQVQREKASELRLPSRAELDRFLRESVIDIETYIDELERLGFADPWPERYALIVIEEVEERDQKRDLSRTLVMKLFERGLIAEEEARVRLLALNFSAADVELLLQLLPEEEEEE